MQALPVKYAFFQTGITIPGVCQGETSSARILGKNLKMTLTDFGIAMTATDEEKNIVQAFVPSTNIKVAVLEPAPPKLKPVA